jgi:glutamine amidotransferase
MVVIIDYGLGNLRSVLGAVEKVGFEGRVSHDVADIERATHLILPGVGAFGDGMANLEARQLIAPLRRAVIEERKPILGICLGAQLLARDSEEFGIHQGLGWIPASVRRIAPSDPALRVPHVGWNGLQQCRPLPLFADVPEGALFYFVHSYHIVCDDPAAIAGEVHYGSPMTAVIQRENVYGTQFHPEKSQLHGLTLLRNFLTRV